MAVRVQDNGDPVAEAMALYTRFDEAAEKAAAAGAPRDFEDCAARMARLIDLLPQRAMINPEDIPNWIRRTISVSIDRVEEDLGADKATIHDVYKHALWHVRRASAIGGSEISTVVKHYRGENGTYGTLLQLWKEKLLQMAPMSSKPEMLRGITAEPWLQMIYHKTYKCSTDERTLQALKGFRWSRMPQMVGTPDDVVIFDETGKRRLLDYKCPSADVNEDYEKNGVSFDYVCQVHHYGLLSQARGMMLADMEVACWDPRIFKFAIYPVERDTELLKEMLRGAQRFWDGCVMQGVAPNEIRPDELTQMDGTMRELGIQAGLLKLLSDEVTSRQKDMIERLTALGAHWHQMAEGKFEMNFASLTRKRNWDADELIRLAQAASIDHAPFMKGDGSLDTKAAEAILGGIINTVKKGEDPLPYIQQLMQTGIPRELKLDKNGLAECLKEQGVPLNTALGVSESFRLSTKKTGLEADMVRRLRNDASDLMDTLENVVEEAALEVLRDPTGEIAAAEAADAAEAQMEGQI